MARNTGKKVRRRGRRRKRGFATWSIGKKIGAVLGGTLLGVVVIGSVILASKMNKLSSVKLDTDKLNISDEVKHEKGYTNVALFGLDSRENDLGKGNRSDTIIIASLNNDTKEVKLVSIYRDTLLELDDGSYNKANSAYSFGGPEGAVSLINRNLDMNIEKYVTVNFNALVDVIDAVGGLDLELTHDEVVHMNNYCVETSKVTGKSYEKIEPEVEGTYHLNGVQAVSYSRIRYTEGGDFKRAERQRLVLQKIADKAQNMSVGTVNKIIDSVFPQISTNFTLAEIIGYAKNLTKYKLGDSIGFPAENTTDMLNEVGSVVIPKTLSSNVLEVHKFLFGSDGYSVSSTIEGIESGITAKASQRSRMMRHREVRGIRKIIPIIHPEPVQQEVPTEQRVEALTEPDIPEEHRREAERPEVQAALPQELREQPEEQKGQQQEVERPEIMQAALREPLDRQKERNK